MGYWWWSDVRRNVRRSNRRWIPFFVLLIAIWLIAYFVFGYQIR